MDKINDIYFIVSAQSSVIVGSLESFCVFLVIKMLILLGEYLCLSSKK
jgi:hypothetical protein